MMRPSDLRKSCTSVVWDKGRRFDIGSHVGLMSQTVAGGFPRLATQRGSNLGHRDFQPSAFRELTIPCRIDTHLLCRDYFDEATRSVLIPAEASPSLRNSIRLE